MASAGWINKIRLLFNGSNNTRITQEFDIGVTFDKVQYSESNGVTLKDITNKLRNYFTSKMFMIYRSTEPLNYNVVQWYKVEPAEINPTTTELSL